MYTQILTHWSGSTWNFDLWILMIYITGQNYSLELMLAKFIAAKIANYLHPLKLTSNRCHILGNNTASDKQYAFECPHRDSNLQTYDLKSSSLQLSYRASCDWVKKCLRDSRNILSVNIERRQHHREFLCLLIYVERFLKILYNREFAISEIARFKFQWKFSSCSVRE